MPDKFQRVPETYGLFTSIVLRIELFKFGGNISTVGGQDSDVQLRLGPEASRVKIHRLFLQSDVLEQIHRVEGSGG